jgi:hypothetical protein
MPGFRQKVVVPGNWFTTSWMFAPGKMSTAPAGQVIVDCGPTPDGAGGGAE